MSTGVNSFSPSRGALGSRRDLVMDQIFFASLSDNFLPVSLHAISSRYLQ